MPIGLQFERDGEGVVLTGHGNTTAEEHLAINNKIYQPEHLAKLRYQILDTRLVEQVDTSFEKIRAIALADKEAAKHCPGMRIAIIVDQAVLEGFAQIYSRIAADKNLSVKIFTRSEQARKWIEEMYPVAQMEQTA